MRAAAAAFWFDYSMKHEGFTPFLYCDTLNLVTTGIGNLVDLGPRNGHVVNAQVMAPAMTLPWRRRAPGWTSKNPLAGELVSPSEVSDAWTICKMHNVDVPGFEQQGGFKYAGLTSITLDLDGIHNLFNSKTASVNRGLVKTYPGFESWPCDAQIGTMSMAWAMGEAFYPVKGFKAFKDAVDRLDFAEAARQCIFQGGGSVTDAGDPAKGRVSSRNHDNALMFNNAAIVQKAGADPDLLWFPATANPSSAPGGLIQPAVFSSTLTRKIASNALPISGGAIGAGLIGWGIYKWIESRR